MAGSVATRVQLVIVVPPVCRAVQRVGAALGDNAHHAARRATVLGGELVRNHAELADRIRIIDLLQQSADGGRIRIRTVNNEVIRTGAHTIHGERDATGRESGVTAGKLADAGHRKRRVQDVRVRRQW